MDMHMVKQQGGRFGSVHPFDGDEAVNDGAWHTSTVPPTAADNNLWSSEYVKALMRENLSNPSRKHPISSQESSDDEHDGQLKRYRIACKLSAEFVGTMLFVFIGCLSGLNTLQWNATLHVALAHGLALFIVISAIGHVSGGHVNPAVTLGVLLAGRLSPLHVIPYWLAQLSGAFVGASLVRVVTNDAEYLSILGGTTLLPNGDAWFKAIVVEVLLTMMLTLVVLNAAVDSPHNQLAPLAIGLTVAGNIIALKSLSGASMNPARSFGPALASVLFLDVTDKSIVWAGHYVYWLGPLIGASISALLHRTLFARGYSRILP